MPIDYKKYPSNWKTEIRPRILDRANNCCEHCGLKNGTVGYRDSTGAFVSMEHLMPNFKRKYVVIDHRVYHLYQTLPNGYKLITIILTIAHLDHNPQNHAVTDDRLAALCQQCHLRYDSKTRQRKTKQKQTTIEQPCLF